MWESSRMLVRRKVTGFDMMIEGFKVVGGMWEKLFRDV